MIQKERNRAGRSGTLMKSVYHSLKEDICNGVIKTGELLSEAQLAERLSVSRTPVREALAALENEGLVDIRRGIGASVKPITAGDLLHIYELRKVLEPMAAKTAVYHLTNAELEHCRKQFLSLLKLRESPQVQVARYADVDWRFHMLIVHRSENYYIERMMNLIIPNVRRIQAMSYRPEEPAESQSLVLEDSVQRHIQLINILKEKDVPKIQKELISHLDWSLADFLASSPLL